MKKLVFLAVACAVLASLVVAPAVIAAGKSGAAGKESNVGHLYLYEKDPESWEIVPGGAWGKLKYNLSGDEFEYLFNGHGLDPGVSYSLIYYADPWPGDNPGALIAIGTANRGGNIHLRGSVDLEMSLPHPDDANYEEEGGDPGTPGAPPTPFPFGGAKIWLVLSDDYNAETNAMTAWNPSEYLFEAELMTYTDTND